ncbi:J domain-containing protein [Coleofasciculus sp. FACHB-129]|uniref:J domain-containing protein n=1 Tax=Cyanophyceae TaxID=3028117 RepID=UPI001683038C|nr:J domain-containing protein [Coleofasciculus sp. FACHB-129]MBD1895906.1 J domain-containing protein [Coleofasciculus sp. FACHB-129]
MNKPTGGRTRKEDYTTSVMRVPDPVKPKVIEVIEKFHQARQPNQPVTSNSQYWQIPASLIPELLDLGGDEPSFETSCGIEKQYVRWWKTEGKIKWEKEWRENLERFNALADRVNECLRQVDNTWTLASSEDVSKAIKRLHECRLIYLDQPATAATPLEAARWVLEASELGWGIVIAFWERRWGILKALEVGIYPPINRREYWLENYAEQLGKPNVNYWQWRQNPESREIAKELTQLLELPEPSEDTRRVLECLAEGKDPFYDPKPREGQMFIGFDVFLTKGALGDCKPDLKQRYREAFRKWHLTVLAQLGQDTLEGIYRVCYGCDWILIESIFAPPLVGEWWEVLQVSPNATLEEVKSAYRTAAKVWHTDVNSSPIAKARITALNKAYEEAKASFTRYKYRV